MRLALAALLSLFCTIAAAQGSTMYKCVDRNKNVTYSNVSCDKQGLTNSGVVVDRTSNVTMPPLTQPKPAAEPAEKPAATPEPKAAPAAAAVQRQPQQQQQQQQYSPPRAPQVVEPRIPQGVQQPQVQQVQQPQQRIPAPKGSTGDMDDIPPLPTVKPPVK